eukprot:6205653-Pleurochrysis_carterae.AAC.1
MHGCVFGGGWGARATREHAYATGSKAGCDPTKRVAPCINVCARDRVNDGARVGEGDIVREWVSGQRASEGASKTASVCVCRLIALGPQDCRPSHSMRARSRTECAGAHARSAPEASGLH